MDYQFENKQVVLNQPVKNPKKITMTRLGAILGVNPYTSPFEAWCEITRVYQKPFEETPELIAGREIEPIVTKWLGDYVYATKNVIDPKQYYGNIYDKIMVKKDFYQKTKIFGGMWDSVLVKNDTKSIRRIFEQKTTKRAEDWQDKTPTYYLLQGLGYCYMEGVKDLTMVASFLQEMDYAHPQKFVPSQANTICRDYTIDEKVIPLQDGKLHTISECFEFAKQWWDQYVVTGISPEYDEVKDKDVLKQLKTSTVDDSTDDFDDICAKYIELNEKINAEKKELETLKSAITTKLSSELNENCNRVEYKRIVLSETSSTRLNTEAIKQDGLYEKYSITTKQTKLTIKKGE